MARIKKATSTNQPKTTAADAYHAAGVEVETLMEALAEALERHRVAHRTTPTNWGYVGDLNHVRELLNEVIEFLPKAGS